MLKTKTPCVGICTATALGDPVCRGCGRTQEEVIAWIGMSDKEKDAINRRLELKFKKNWNSGSGELLLELH